MLGTLVKSVFRTKRIVQCKNNSDIVHMFSIPGKIGYGTFSEAMAYKLPFVFVRRDYFNEEPFLRNMLEVEFQFVLSVFDI